MFNGLTFSSKNQKKSYPITFKPTIKFDNINLDDSFIHLY